MATSFLPPSDEFHRCVVDVSNVGSKDENTLRNLFYRCGEIVDVQRWMSNKSNQPHAFITFNDPRDAEAAVAGRAPGVGKELPVLWATATSKRHWVRPRRTAEQQRYYNPLGHVRVYPAQLPPEPARVQPALPSPVTPSNCHPEPFSYDAPTTSNSRHIPPPPRPTPPPPRPAKQRRAEDAVPIADPHDPPAVVAELRRKKAEQKRELDMHRAEVKRARQEHQEDISAYQSRIEELEGKLESALSSVGQPKRKHEEVSSDSEATLEEEGLLNKRRKVDAVAEASSRSVKEITLEAKNVILEGQMKKLQGVLELSASRHKQLEDKLSAALAASAAAEAAKVQDSDVSLENSRLTEKVGMLEAELRSVNVHWTELQKTHGATTKRVEELSLELKAAKLDCENSEHALKEWTNLSDDLRTQLSTQSRTSDEKIADLVLERDTLMQELLAIQEAIAPWAERFQEAERLHDVVVKERQVAISELEEQREKADQMEKALSDERAAHQDTASQLDMALRSVTLLQQEIQSPIAHLLLGTLMKTDNLVAISRPT